MKKYFSLLIVAVGFSNNPYAQNKYQASEENQPSQENRTVVDVNSPVIKVSDVLYKDIVEWLKLTNTGQKPGRIDEYLKSKSEDQEDVASFLKDYSSDVAVTSPSKKGSATGSDDDGGGGIDPEGPCNCKSIVPTGTTQKSINPNVINYPDYDSGDDINYTTTMETDGVALNGKLTQKGNTHSGSRSFNLEGLYTYRILNLCTQLGELTDECNCDKNMGVQGEYYIQR